MFFQRRREIYKQILEQIAKDEGERNGLIPEKLFYSSLGRSDLIILRPMPGFSIN